MNSFASILLVSPLADGSTWVVMRDFDFQPAAQPAARAEAGFQTDFASIPRPFWVFLPKWG